MLIASEFVLAVLMGRYRVLCNFVVQFMARGLKIFRKHSILHEITFKNSLSQSRDGGWPC